MVAEDASRRSVVSSQIPGVPASIKWIDGQVILISMSSHVTITTPFATAEKTAEVLGVSKSRRTSIVHLLTKTAARSRSKTARTPVHVKFKGKRVARKAK
jgi:hypothetical protein